MAILEVLGFKDILVIFWFWGYFGHFFWVSGGILVIFRFWGILVFFFSRVFRSFFRFRRYFGHFLGFRGYFGHFWVWYFGNFVGFGVILVVFRF